MLDQTTRLPSSVTTPGSATTQVHYDDRRDYPDYMLGRRGRKPRLHRWTNTATSPRGSPRPKAMPSALNHPELSPPRTPFKRRRSHLLTEETDPLGNSDNACAFDTIRPPHISQQPSTSSTDNRQGADLAGSAPVPRRCSRAGSRRHRHRLRVPTRSATSPHIIDPEVTSQTRVRLRPAQATGVTDADAKRAGLIQPSTTRSGRIVRQNKLDRPLPTQTG